jgi:hypothetical protein
MERIWAIGVLKGSNSVALGFDEGLVVVKIGEHLLAELPLGEPVQEPTY